MRNRDRGNVTRGRLGEARGTGHDEILMCLKRAAVERI
jgi:hypothetical protein